ncbi:MAG TPA: YihY/virulence factor BrkB family protein [Bryobacteraceae bacterium]|nr:YihY/virulence factor BrkB family protein [Bryobacteraceae bacterium]
MKAPRSGWPRRRRDRLARELAPFSWYIANFGNYNATYGSLGAAIGMMMWMWVSMIVILVGAQLNAEIEHRPRAIRPKDRRSRSARAARSRPTRSGLLKVDAATPFLSKLRTDVRYKSRERPQVRILGPCSRSR